MRRAFGFASHRCVSCRLRRDTLEPTWCGLEDRCLSFRRRGRKSCQRSSSIPESQAINAESRAPFGCPAFDRSRCWSRLHVRHFWRFGSLLRGLHGGRLDTSADRTHPRRGDRRRPRFRGAGCEAIRHGLVSARVPVKKSRGPTRVSEATRIYTALSIPGSRPDSHVTAGREEPAGDFRQPSTDGAEIPVEKRVENQSGATIRAA